MYLLIKWLPMEIMLAEKDAMDANNNIGRLFQIAPIVTAILIITWIPMVKCANSTNDVLNDSMSITSTVNIGKNLAKFTFDWKGGLASAMDFANSGNRTNSFRGWNNPPRINDTMSMASSIFSSPSQRPGIRKISASNNPPNTPSMPSGMTICHAGTFNSYSTNANDPDGDQVKYLFDWGDGSTSETDFVNSGTSVSMSHSWNTPPGTYNITAMATDIYGATSQLSSINKITVFNNPPNTPSIPLGSSIGYTQILYNYSSSTTDPDGDPIKYTFDWGDGWTSETAFVASGTNLKAYHCWNTSPGTYSIKAMATDFYGASSPWSGCKNVTISSINPLNAPSIPLGPGIGHTGIFYNFSTSATDRDGLQLKYTFDWGDGSTSESGFVNSGTNIISSHSWNNPSGTYEIKAKATNVNGAISPWSASKNIAVSNQIPNTPTTSGPSAGHAGISYNYSISSIDPDGDQVKYTIDWGDGTTSDTSFVSSGTTSMASHIWMIPGTFNVSAKATDSCVEPSNWSDPRTVTVTVKVCC